MVDLREHAELLAQARVDERCGDRRQVDTDPLPTERLGAHARGRAAAERVQDDVALVRARRDDAVEQGERFLRRVASAFRRSVPDPRNVRPDVLQTLPGSVGQEDLQAVKPRCSISLRADSALTPLLELLDAETPASTRSGSRAAPGELPRIAIRARRRQVLQPVSTAIFIYVLEAAQLLLAVLLAACVHMKASVPGRSVTQHVEQERVGDVAIAIGRVVGARARPGNRVPETRATENTVTQNAQVRTCRIVAVQVERPGRLQHPAQLEQPHGHHREVRPHRLPVHHAGGLDRRVHPRLAVSNLAVPGDVDVAQRPRVLERGAGGLRADGRGVVLVGVERRVGVHQVDAVGVQAAQDVEVVPRPHRAVGEVRRRRHGRRLPTRRRPGPIRLSPQSVFRQVQLDQPVDAGLDPVEPLVEPVQTLDQPVDAGLDPVEPPIGPQPSRPPSTATARVAVAIQGFMLGKPRAVIGDEPAAVAAPASATPRSAPRPGPPGPGAHAPGRQRAHRPCRAPRSKRGRPGAPPDGRPGARRRSPAHRRRHP